MSESRQPTLRPPTDSRELGRRGEELAVRLLLRDGWVILDRNWRDGRREIDVVATRAGQVAFIEVKARSPGPQAACEAVTRSQRRNICKAAAAWLHRHPGIGRSFRFDVIAVTDGPGGTATVVHVPGAFEADDP